MNNIIKTLFADKNGNIVFKNVEDKNTKKGFIKIRSKVSLISPGTEMHYRKKACIDSNDTVLGYCLCGVVVDVGEGVKGFSINDRVIAMGLNYAFHAEQVMVPYRLCVKIPDDMRFDKAVFSNLLATSVHAVDRANIGENKNILVVGAGLVGQLTAAYLSANHNIMIADLVSERLNIAKKNNIKTVNTGDSDWKETVKKNTDNKGVDAVYICCSGEISNLMTDIFELFSNNYDGIKKGKIIFIGRCSANINFNVTLGNIDIINSARCGLGYKDYDFEVGNKDYPESIDQPTVSDNLRRSVEYIKNIDTDVLITDRYHFDDAADAYSSIENGKSSIGILIEYN